jgi:putative membrane protein
MADSYTSPAKTSTELSQERTGLADERTDLALDRTVLAHERTLMAWTRTATSLISFGFTIYTFFENFGNRDASRRVVGSANFALVMISAGLICLLLATMRHWQEMQHMRAEYDAKPRYLAFVLAAMVSVLGILGLAAVVFRV